MGRLEKEREGSTCVLEDFWFGWLVGFLFWVFVFFLPQCVASGILASKPGIEPGSSTIRVWIPNHWTTREFPTLINIVVAQYPWGIGSSTLLNTKTCEFSPLFYEMV